MQDFSALDKLSDFTILEIFSNVNDSIILNMYCYFTFKLWVCFNNFVENRVLCHILCGKYSRNKTLVLTTNLTTWSFSWVLILLSLSFKFSTLMHIQHIECNVFEKLLIFGLKIYTVTLKTQQKPSDFSAYLRRMYRDINSEKLLNDCEHKADSMLYCPGTRFHTLW